MSAIAMSIGDMVGARMLRHGARHVDKALQALPPGSTGTVIDEAAARTLLSHSLVREPVHHATRADAIAPIVADGFRIPAGTPSSTGAGVYTSVAPDAAWGEVMLRVAVPTERPFHVRSTEELFDGIRALGREDLVPTGGATSFDGRLSQELRTALRERGYDSIVRDHDDGARWVIGLEPDAVRVVR